MIDPAWIELAKKEAGLRSSRLRAEELSLLPGAVGFYRPHEDGRGYFRLGPIWIHPGHRGQGLAAPLIYRLSKGKRCAACVFADNEPAVRAFRRAGYEDWYWTKGRIGLFLRREEATP